MPLTNPRESLPWRMAAIFKDEVPVWLAALSARAPRLVRTGTSGLTPLNAIIDHVTAEAGSSRPFVFCRVNIHHCRYLRYHCGTAEARTTHAACCRQWRPGQLLEDDTEGTLVAARLRPFARRAPATSARPCSVWVLRRCGEFSRGNACLARRACGGQRRGDKFRSSASVTK